MTAYTITVATSQGDDVFKVTAPTVAAALRVVAADSPRDPGRDDLDHAPGQCPECDRVRALRKLADSFGRRPQ